MGYIGGDWEPWKSAHSQGKQLRAAAAQAQHFAVLSVQEKDVVGETGWGIGFHSNLWYFLRWINWNLKDHLLNFLEI